MKKQNLKEFESRLEKMNPRKRRPFLHSLYSDLMGCNQFEDIDATVANSPHLRQSIDNTLQEEREFMQEGARILERFGFTSHAKKLVDSYQNPSISVDPSQGYTADNRTRPLDRLLGMSERTVLFPTKFGHVIQVETHKDGHVGFCVSDEPMTGDEAREKYSVENFPIGISGYGFGVPIAKTILEEKAEANMVGIGIYDDIQEKPAFKEAVKLALELAA